MTTFRLEQIFTIFEKNSDYFLDKIWILENYEILTKIEHFRQKREN